MSPAERWRRRSGLARALVAAMRRWTPGIVPIDGGEAAVREARDDAADYLEAGLAEPAPVAEDADSTSALRYLFDLASVTREQDGTFTLRAPDDSGRTICGAAREQALGVIAARWGAAPAEPAPGASACDDCRDRPAVVLVDGHMRLCSACAPKRSEDRTFEAIGPVPVAGVSAEDLAQVRALADDVIEIQDTDLRVRLSCAARAMLAALDAAEVRAAKWKERVGIGIKAYEERVDAAAALRLDLAEANAALVREREAALACRAELDAALRTVARARRQAQRLHDILDGVEVPDAG